MFANFAQNSVFFFAVNTPLMLRLAHETFFGTGIPAHGWAKWMLGSAFVLQLCYDAYWTTRLWSSYARRAGREGMRAGGWWDPRLWLAGRRAHALSVFPGPGSQLPQGAAVRRQVQGGQEGGLRGATAGEEVIIVVSASRAHTRPFFVFTEPGGPMRARGHPI